MTLWINIAVNINMHGFQWVNDGKQNGLEWYWWCSWL